MTDLTILFGLPGSGKSFLAERLASEINAVHLNTDRIREAIGLNGRYDKASKLRVYEALCLKAADILRQGEPVVLDGTFHSLGSRQFVYDLEDRMNIQARWIEVICDEAVALSRVSKKRKYTEADQEVYQKIRSERQAFEKPHLVIDTSHTSVEENILLIKSYIP